MTCFSLHSDTHTECYRSTNDVAEIDVLYHTKGSDLSEMGCSFYDCFLLDDDKDNSKYVAK